MVLLEKGKNFNLDLMKKTTTERQYDIVETEIHKF